MSKPTHGDEKLKVTKALPNGAAATSSDPIDFGHGTTGDVNLGRMELLLEAPALNTTQQPNSKTMIYDIETSVDNSNWTVQHKAAITQTGAGGAGAAVATKRIKPASDWGRYCRFTATGSASGDASAASATLRLVT